MRNGGNGCCGVGVGSWLVKSGNMRLKSGLFNKEVGTVEFQGKVYRLCPAHVWRVLSTLWFLGRRESGLQTSLRHEENKFTS